MPNVVAIIQDDRARRQTEQYLLQLEMDDLRYATFKTHQEFTALYFHDAPEVKEEKPEEDKEDTSPPPEPEPGDLKLFGEVHLVIFALDSVGEKPGTFLDKLRLNLKRYKHWPSGGPVRVILLKYEDDGVTKLDVLHPLLDDLIYLPLDRLVFLQKLEIILNLPKRIKPSFLFNQEFKADIEISKITKLDRLSDVGLAIRNPMPLKKGLPGHFYINLPGEKTRLEIRGKVFRSEPHPELPGQYLVYFTYFGLQKSELSMIRRALSKANRYQSLYNDDPSVFRFRPDDLFAAGTDSKFFGVAVLDPDVAAGVNLAKQITKDMDRLKVFAESSYTLFLHQYLHGAGDGGAKTPPTLTSDADFYKLPLTLTVSTSDYQCMSVDPGPSDGDLLLGRKAMDVFATPEYWLNLVIDQESRLVLEEAVQFAGRGRPSSRMLILHDVDSAPRAVNFNFQKSSAENLVNIEISPASLSDVAAIAHIEEKYRELEVIICDSAFVPEDTQAWIEGLRSRALQLGMIKDTSALKFFITAEGDTGASRRWLDIADVLGYFIKPVDTRQLGFLMSEYLPNKNTVYQYENLGWSQPNLPIHASKNVQLESLSEYGARLKTKLRLTPGTMIFLRRSIFDNAPNQCLAARVYSCEDHPSEKGYFQVYTLYFGINDQFLKFARTWIRDNYAQQKGREF